MTVYFYAALIVLLSVLLVINITKTQRTGAVNRRGKLPLKGKATMFDVRHLLMEGQKELAIEIYCEIFNVSFNKAKNDVEELQRSLKV